MTNGAQRWILEIVLAITLPVLGWAGGAYTKFAPLETRIAVLEEHQRAIDYKLDEIREDIKTLLAARR